MNRTFLNADPGPLLPNPNDADAPIATGCGPQTGNQDHLRVAIARDLGEW